MATTYMQRRKGSGIYEFRKRLPLSLAGKPAPEHVRQAFPDLVNAATGRFKRELVKSLGTSNAVAARKADHKAAHGTLVMLEAAEILMREDPVKVSSPSAAAPTFTASDLQTIEAEARAGVLRQDDEARWQDYRATEQGRSDREGLHLLSDASAGGPFGLKEGGLEGRGIEIAMMLEDYSGANARQDTTAVRGEVKAFLRARGVAFDQDSADHHRVGLAILRGTLAGYRGLAERQRGETLLTPALPSPESRSPPQAAPEPYVSAYRGPLLSVALASWERGGDTPNGRRPSPSSGREAGLAVRLFVELHGDKAVGDITKEDARTYARALAKVPKRLTADLRALPLPKLLSRDLSGLETRDVGTVNKLINMVAAVVSHAKREGLLDHVPGFANPFDEDVKLRASRVGKDDREVFTPSDLKLLFAAGVFTRGDRPRGGGGEAAFWFPIIGLLSGLRQNEIAGLLIEDLRQDETTGSWLFDIHARSGRTIKTESSKRKVPVHPALITVGLLRYREATLAAVRRIDAPLWPDVKSSTERALSAAWSQWFGRYLRTHCGITDTRKVYHSFRHTFKQAARDAGVPREVHDAITGHSDGSVSDGYGGTSFKTLASAMATIETPDVVLRLIWAEGDSRRPQIAKRRPGVNLQAPRGGRTQAPGREA